MNLMTLTMYPFDMWSYYGSKANIIDLYPRPKHSKIIEPFAGSARYALAYFEHEILLVDKYDVIVNIWKWLQMCSIDDIKKLPHFVKPGQSLDALDLDCIEAKHLMGFLTGFGMERPRKNASVDKMTTRPNHVNHGLKRIEKNLFKIKHWQIELGSYDSIKNQKATWFIDPPYQFGGHSYPHSNRKIDFVSLAEWCRARDGQTIVCENRKANWMDFLPMVNQKGSKGNQKEVIWSNESTVFDNVQTTLFK